MTHRQRQQRKGQVPKDKAVTFVPTTPVDTRGRTTSKYVRVGHMLDGMTPEMALNILARLSVVGTKNREN